MTIIAIDPGIKIGCAVKIHHDVPEYATCTFDNRRQLWNAIMCAPDPLVIIVENFATGGRVDTNMLATVEILGGVKAIADVRNGECWVQQPQERISFRTDAINILRAQGRHVVDTKAQDNHEIDALAHLLTWEYYEAHPDKRPKHKEEL